MTFNFPILSRAKEAWQYRSEPEEMRVLTAIFWRALLVFVLIVAIAALWFGAQELDAVSQIESSVPTPSSTPLPLDRSQLDSALGSYTARQAQYQSLSQSPAPAPADPSK